MKPWVALVLSSSMLVACGGGGGSSPLPKTTTSSPSKALVQVKITMRVPGAASAHTPALKRRFTVAQNTAGAQVNVYAAGQDTGTPLATTTANVEPSTVLGSTCAISDNYGNRACTFALSAPAGSDDFVITTWDQAPPSAGAAIPLAALQLGVGTDPAVPIVAGSSASVSATLSSVLASVSLDLTPSVLHQVIPSTGTVGVYALDADNDVIVSNGFSDPSGNPIALSFSLDNSLNGALFLSTSSITAPSPSGIQYIYAPSGVLGTSANATVNVSVASSYSAVTSTGAALSALYPTFTSISDPNLSVNNIHHGGMVFDTSGGVYYTTPSNSGGISYYPGTGSSLSGGYAANLTAPLLGSIVNSNGTLVALLGNTENTFAAPPSSTLGAGPNSTAVPVPNGSALAYDPGTNLIWYTSGSSVVSYPAFSGSPTAVSIGVNATAGVAVDSSHNVWIVDNANNRIIEYPGGNSPLQGGGAPWDVLTNSSGVFVTDHGPNPAILQLNSGGSLQDVITTDGAAPWYMMPDNAQPGIIWFDYLLNGQIGIGRMDTNVNPATFVMATDVNGPTNGVQVGAIGTASNGLVYMVFDNTSTLVQVAR